MKEAIEEAQIYLSKISGVLGEGIANILLESLQ